MWTDARIERLTEMWPTGVTASVIALEVKKSRSAVLAKANRLNLPSRRPSIVTPFPSPPVYCDPQRVSALHLRGYRWSEIATILGVAESTVYNAAKHLGISQRLAGHHWATVIPAGHPRTWGLINKGLTTLEGVRYGSR